MASMKPLTKFYFRVDWGDAAGNARFTEVTGLEMEWEIIEHRDGSSPNFAKEPIMGMKKFPAVTLKRGTFLNDNGFYDWINPPGQPVPQPRPVTIFLLDADNNPVVKWTLSDALPAKITSTDLKSDDNAVAIETLVLRHSGLTIEHLA